MRTEPTAGAAIDLVAAFAGAGADPAAVSTPEDETSSDSEAPGAPFAELFASAAEALGSTGAATSAWPLVPVADATAREESLGAPVPMPVEEAFAGSTTTDDFGTAAPRGARFAGRLPTAAPSDGAGPAADAFANGASPRNEAAGSAVARGDVRIATALDFQDHSKSDIGHRMNTSVQAPTPSPFPHAATPFAPAAASELPGISPQAVTTPAPAPSERATAEDGSPTNHVADVSAPEASGGDSTAAPLSDAPAESETAPTESAEATTPAVSAEDAAGDAPDDRSDHSRESRRTDAAAREPHGTARADSGAPQRSAEAGAPSAPAHHAGSAPATADSNGAPASTHLAWKSGAPPPATDAAPAARTAPANEAPLAWTPQIHHELAAKARSFLDRGEAEIRITLDPPSLGRLSIKLEIAPGRVAAHLVATSPHTAALLDRDREELVRAFEAQGIDDVSVHVTSERSFREGGEPHERRAPHDPFGEPARLAPPDDEPTIEVRPARRFAVDLVA